MKNSRRQHIVLRRSTASDAVGDKHKGRDVQTSAPRKTSAPPVHTLDENIAAIKGWEEESLHHRSRTELLSDAITRFAAGGPVLLFHVVWFTFWILANLGSIPGVTPFDPFPFPLLTMTVSLEAIFLSLFVLASQNRLSHQADKREHLDLQIDLLAEREMTTVLKLLQDIARHLGAKVSVTPEQIRDLARKTDLDRLTHKMEEIPEAGSSKQGTASEGPQRKTQ